MGCLPKVVEAVDVARSSGVPIIWVIREHDADGGLPRWAAVCCHAAALSRGSFVWGVVETGPETQLLFRLGGCTCAFVCTGTDVELFRQPMFKEGKASTVPGTPGALCRRMEESGGWLFSCSFDKSALRRHLLKAHCHARSITLHMLSFCSSCPGLAGVQLVEPLAAAPGERILVKKRFR